MANDPDWMEKAHAKMKEKGTLGSFGKATPKKIARAKKEGGKMEKKAIFAENAKKAHHHKDKEHEKKKAKKKERPLTYFSQHTEHD